MRAALLVAVKVPFEVEEIDFLDPAPGRVLVRTGASPFCSTDCVNWRGELGKIPPTILGHASMGEVLEVGAGVAHVKVGDRVIVPGTSECGVCFYCSIGRPDQCSETFDRAGIWPHVANRHNGQPVSAAGNVGGYAEVMNVTANQVFPVQSDLPDEWLSLLGCGITTGLGAGLQRRPGAAGLERRGRRPRAPRAMDGAGGEARCRALDHRRRPDAERRETAQLWAPPTSSTRPRRPGRAGAGSHRRSWRGLRPRGGNPRHGPDAGDPDVATGRNRRPHERRARRRHRHRSPGRDRRAKPRHHQRSERQCPHAPRPAALHPHDGGRLGHAGTDHHEAATPSTRSTTPCTLRPRSVTSAG